MKRQYTMGIIPTKYKGIEFKSRLEARWARYLDLLGYDWIYENETYQLEDGTWYCPDFYLPKYKIFIEDAKNYKFY